jgi:hypothetical protein
VFIGSSSEGLPIAKAIQVNLDHACEIVIWSQGVFGLSEGTLDTLVDKAGEFDFAILVVTPDDMTRSRRKKQQSPRDNVLLELGLFIGTIGRKRTFVVYDRTAGLKLPSDLAGVTLAGFQPPSGGTLQAAVGAACTQIETAINEQAVLPPRGSRLTGELEIEQKALDAYTDGGNAKRLVGIWKATWHVFDRDCKANPHLVEDPGNAGKLVVYPDEQIVLASNGSMVFCTSRDSMSSGKVYWLGGRFSYNNELSLIYWNDFNYMGGTVFLALIETFPFPLKLQGWWSGHTRNHGVVCGPTEWVQIQAATGAP